MANEAGGSDPPMAPQRRWRRLIAWLVGSLLFLVLALVAFVGWLGATNAGLARLAEFANSAAHGVVQISGVDGRLIDRLSIARLRVELPDLRIEAEQLALVWVPARLFDRRLDITRLAVGRLRVATRAGEKSAPLVPESVKIPLELGLEEFSLGELSLHDWAEQGLGAEQFRSSMIEARLHAGVDGLLAEAVSAELPWGKAVLSGRIAAERPFALDLSGRLDGSLEGRDYRIEAHAGGDLLRPLLTIQAEGAGLSGDARVVARSFEPVPLESAVISLDGIDPAAFKEGAPVAALRIRADLAVAAAAEGQLPAPAQWAVSGPVEVVNAKPGAWNDGRMPLERLAARLDWSAGELRAGDIDASLPGKGRVGGQALWRPAGDDPVGQLEATLKLSRINPQALDARLPAARLEGRIEGSGDGRRQQFAASIRDAQLSLDLSAVLENSVLELSRLALARGQARLVGEGRLGIAEPMPFSARLKLDRFDPQALFATAPQADLNAALVVEGELAASPQAQVDFRFDPSALEGRELEGAGRLSVSANRLSEANFWLALAGNRLDARGSWGVEGDQLRLSLEADALGALHPDLAGRVSATALLAGSPEEPSGELLVSASRMTLPGGVTLTGLNLQGEMQRGLDGPFTLAAGAGEILAADRAVLLDRASVSVEGRRGDHRVKLNVARGGGDELSALLSGGLDETFAWQGSLESFQTQGRIALRLEAPAELSMTRNAVRLGSARLGTENGAVDIVELAFAEDGLHLEGRMSGLKIGLEHDAEGRLRRQSGELQLGGEWDLRIGEQINGLARIFREAGDLVLVGDAPAKLGLQTLEVVISATDGALAVSAEAEGSRLGKLSASLTAHAERSGGALRLVPEAPVIGSARLVMPSIAWLGKLVNANLVTEGALEAELSLSGTPNEPQASGRLFGDDLELNLLDVGLRLSGGSLEAFFDREYLRIAKFEFLSPNRVRPREPRIPIEPIVAKPGRFAASGGINIATGEGRFGFLADRLPLLQRVDRWLAVSGEGAVDTGWDRLQLRADLAADAGSISIGAAPPPSLSDDVVILGRERSAGRFAVSADITVRMGENFYLTAMGLDTRLAGGLQVTVRSGQPTRASGVIRMEDGGYEGYGQKLAVENSSVNFSGSPENPALNITALRKGFEVEAGVSVTGTARRPRVRLVSFPNVPDTEKLSWIVLGRAPDPNSSADLGLLIPAAQALLGGPGGGFTSELSRTLGFDQFSIGQGDLNSVSRGATSSVVDSGTRTSDSGTIGGQVVTLGKRLSIDTVLAFEQSLAGAASIVKLTHQLGRRLSVVARGGTDNAIDIFYTFVFR